MVFSIDRSFEVKLSGIIVSFGVLLTSDQILESKKTNEIIIFLAIRYDFCYCKRFIDAYKGKRRSDMISLQKVYRIAHIDSIDYI